MLHLTKEAAHELKMIQDHVQAQLPGAVPRLLEAEGTFELAVDLLKEGDEVLYHADEKVLIMDQETSRMVAEATLVCKETPRGRALVLEIAT